MMLKVGIFMVINLGLVHGCCTPFQWEGYEGVIAGYIEEGVPKKMEGSIKVSYDAENEKVAAVSRFYINGRLENAKTILDYEKGLQYVIYRGQCNTTSLKPPFQKACIPADSKLVLDTHLGTGHASLDVSFYAMNVKGIQISAGVTNDGCIPTGETLSGNVNGVSFLETVGFFGIEAGIKDPRVFDPPRFCKSEPFHNATVHRMPHHVTRMTTKFSHLGF